MVSILQKDIFISKSNLQRIDQLLGMKNKDHLCLVQLEDNKVLFEVWNMIEEKVIVQNKVNLYNYELSSNVIILESNQLAFYGVIQNSVDLIQDTNNLAQQCRSYQTRNQFITKMMVEEQQLNSINDGISFCRSMTDNISLNKFQHKDTAESLNMLQHKKLESNTKEMQFHPQPRNFKKQNLEDKDTFETNFLNDNYNDEQKGNIEQKVIYNKNNFHKNIEVNNNKIEKYNNPGDTALNSFPIIEDKNLPLFMQQLADKQENSLINSYITQDIQGTSGINDLQNIIDDINCINKFEGNEPNQNNMLNNKDYSLLDIMQIKIENGIEQNQLSLQENCSLTNSNIQNHELLKVYAQDIQYQSHPHSNYQIIQDFKQDDDKNNNYQIQLCEESNYKYLHESKEISCIYDFHQKDLFQKCIEFHSQILGQGYNGTIIVKNTYYMTNYDESNYMLLVLSVYSIGSTQQQAQYIIRKEVNILNNKIQVICVQNSHQIIVYDHQDDELIIWSYYELTLMPNYYVFQQFQRLYIKYCFQNSTQTQTYNFIYKDHASNLYKVLIYDFKTGNNVTKGFPNKEMSSLSSPILIKQQEAYLVKFEDENLLIISTIYKNSDLTTYWNAYKLKCSNSNQQQGEGFSSQIHTHLDSFETDNNDIKTHFVPDFSLVSPNIFFFNTSDIHTDVQSAINTFIHNKDIHFKAIQIIQD